MGCKLHLAGEGTGLLLSVLVTAANTPDAVVFESLLDDLPEVRTPAGGRRCRPDKCHADKAYDDRRCGGYLTRRGIKVRIARRGVESSDRLGRHRWKAERSIAWLAGCRRLRIRYDRDSGRFFALPCWPARGCATTGCPALPIPTHGHHDQSAVAAAAWQHRRGAGTPACLAAPTARVRHARTVLGAAAEQQPAGVAACRPGGAAEPVAAAVGAVWGQRGARVVEQHRLAWSSRLRTSPGSSAATLAGTGSCAEPPCVSGSGDAGR